jgi:hypothetical protein
MWTSFRASSSAGTDRIMSTTVRRDTFACSRSITGIAAVHIADDVERSLTLTSVAGNDKVLTPVVASEPSEPERGREQEDVDGDTESKCAERAIEPGPGGE